MSSGPRRIDAAELQRCARLNALLEVREIVRGRVDMFQKDAMMPHHLHEAESTLWLINAMIAKEQR